VYDKNVGGECEEMGMDRGAADGRKASGGHEKNMCVSEIQTNTFAGSGDAGKGEETPSPVNGCLGGRYEKNWATTGRQG